MYVGLDLTKEQGEDVDNLIINNQDVFSSVPGRTTVIQHKIVTPPGVKVKVRPYTIPEAKREDMHKEVENMLKIDVIEESSSPRRSPIVMVAKPNGTWKFWNDFGS